MYVHKKSNSNLKLNYISISYSGGVRFAELSLEAGMSRSYNYMFGVVICLAMGQSCKMKCQIVVSPNAIWSISHFNTIYLF